MTNKDLNYTIKQLLAQPNVCTIEEKIQLLQNLTKFLPLSDLNGSEEKYYDVLKIYIQSKLADIQIVALDLLVACLKLGLFKKLPNKLTLNLAYSVIYVSTQLKEIVECQEIWLKAFTALEYMDDLYVDICRTRGPHMITILHNALSFHITTSMHKLKALQILDMLITTTDIEALMDSIFATWREQIWPLAHNLNNMNLQSAAYDVSVRLLPHLQKYLQEYPEHWDIVLADILNKHLPVVQQILSDENVLYGKLWIFMVKLMGSKFHKGSTIVNSMLQCMENAFRNQEPEIRKHAFLCWQVLIDSYTGDTTEVYTVNRLKLFSMPLRINNAKTEELVKIKFDTWCKLLDFLQKKNLCCSPGILDSFLNFCFGSLCDSPLIYYRDNAVGLLSQGKRFSSMHLRSCKALLQLIGNPKYIDEHLRSKLKYFNFQGISFSQEQFIDISRNIIYSVGESCVMLSILSSNDRAELYELNDALWKSLFSLIDAVIIEGDKCKVIQELSTLILALIGVAKRKPAIISFAIEPLFNLITSDDFRVFRHEKFSECLFIPMLAAVMKKDKILLQYDIVSIIQKVFIFKRKYANYPEFVYRSLNLLLRRSVYKETLDRMLKIWFMFEEELNYHISHTPKENFNSSLYSSIFEEFFYWPLPHLSVMANSKYVCSKWKELYDLIGRSKFVLHYRLLNNLSHLLMQSIKPLISDKPNDEALADIAFVIVSNLKMKECDIGSYSDVEGVCNELKSIVSIINLTPEVVEICELCVQHLLNNCSNLSYIHHLLTPISGCIGSLLDIYNKTDILAPTLAFVEKIDHDNEQIKPGLENLIDFLSQYKARGIQKVAGVEPEPQIEQSDSQKAFEKTDQEQVMVLLGHDVKTNTPVKLKGSFLKNITDVNPKTETSTATETPTTTKVKDVKEEEFVFINSPYKFDPKKLTTHQREKMSTRRDDIPALYQDLTQSNDFNSSETVSQDFNAEVLKSNVEVEKMDVDASPSQLTTKKLDTVEESTKDELRVTRNSKRTLPEPEKESKRLCIPRRKSISVDAPSDNIEVVATNNNSCNKELRPVINEEPKNTRSSKKVLSDTKIESPVQPQKIKPRMPPRRKSLGLERPSPDLEIMELAENEKRSFPRRRRSALLDRPPDLEIFPVSNNNVVETIEKVKQFNEKTKKLSQKVDIKKSVDISNKKVSECSDKTEKTKKKASVKVEESTEDVEKLDECEKKPDVRPTNNTDKIFAHIEQIIEEVVEKADKTDETSDVEVTKRKSGRKQKTSSSLVTPTEKYIKPIQESLNNFNNSSESVGKVDKPKRGRPFNKHTHKKNTLLAYNFGIKKEHVDIKPNIAEIPSTSFTSPSEGSIDHRVNLFFLNQEIKNENPSLTEKKPKKITRERRSSAGCRKKLEPLDSGNSVEEKSDEPLNTIKKEKMKYVESELRRLTMDINDRDDYIKTDKRKTRLATFQALMDSPESPKCLRSSRSPPNTYASEKRRKKHRPETPPVGPKHIARHFPRERTPPPINSESESIIESSQEEPEILIRECKVPALYPLESMKPGDEFIINTGSETVDVVKQPENNSPFKLTISKPAAEVDINASTCKKLSFSDSPSSETIEEHSYSVASKSLSEDELLDPEFIAIKTEENEKLEEKETPVIRDIITSTTNEPDLNETESVSICEMDPLSDDQMDENVDMCKTRKVLLNESIFTDEMDKTEIVTTPIPNKLLDKIPTSPVLNDTPTRNKELLRDTIQISPIKNVPQPELPNNKCVESAESVKVNNKNEEKEGTCSPEMFESQQTSTASGSGMQKPEEGEKLSGNASNYTKLETKTRSRNLFGRSAQMMNLMSLKPVTSQTSIRKLKTVHLSTKPETTNVFTSPTQGRISKMLKNYEKSDSNKETPKPQNSENSTTDVVEIEMITPKRTEQQSLKPDDLLIFMKVLPSPFDTPSKSILKKRKLSLEDEEETGQVSKKRRVNFHDPPVSCTKFYEKASHSKSDPASKAEKLSKALGIQIGTEHPEHGIVEDNSDNLTYDNKTSICEALVSCMDSIKILVPKLTTLDFSDPVLSVLKSRHIMSVGDLAKLTELQVFEIPLKVEVVRSALTDYHESLSKDTPTRQRRKIKPVILYSPTTNNDSIKTKSTRTSSEVSVITTIKSKELKTAIEKDVPDKEINSLPLFSEDSAEHTNTLINEKLFNNEDAVKETIEKPVNDEVIKETIENMELDNDMEVEGENKTQEQVVTECNTEKDAEITTEMNTEKETQATTEINAEKHAQITTEMNTEKDAQITTEINTEKDTQIIAEMNTEKDTQMTTEINTKKDAQITTKIINLENAITTIDINEETETLIVNYSEGNKIDEMSEKINVQGNTEVNDEETDSSQDTVILESPTEESIVAIDTLFDHLPEHWFTNPILRKHVKGKWVERMGVEELPSSILCSPEEWEVFQKYIERVKPIIDKKKK